MLKKIFTTSGLLGMALHGMAFVFIRLGMVAIALNIVLGTIHPLPVLQMASVAVGVASMVWILVRVVQSVVSGGDVIDRLHGLSQRTVGVFWLSLLGFVVWALAAMVWGSSVAPGMAAIWAGTVTVLLSYWLVREVWAVVPPVAVLESLLGLRPANGAGCVKNHDPRKTIDSINNHAKRVLIYL